MFASPYPSHHFTRYLDPYRRLESSFLRDYWSLTLISDYMCWRPSAASFMAIFARMETVYDSVVYRVLSK